jgi:diguanylate cyclase (GGDEF)-like protein
MDVEAGFGVVALLVAGSVVTAIGAALLIAAARQMREAALRWWAAALFARTIAGLLLAVGFARSIPLFIVAASILIPLGGTAVWAGTRIFHRLSAPWWVFVLVAVAWLVGTGVPLPSGATAAALATGMGLSSAVLVAAGFELWRGRAEKLVGRWLLIGIIGLHAPIFILGALEVADGTVRTSEPPPAFSWFTLAHLEFVMFLLASALLAVMMCTERLERKRLAAATLDSLTGVTNRAAFFENAERILRRVRGTPVSIILFDLDGFKNINDAYGHAAGDRVLRTFCDVARDKMRSLDLIGRIGGEEFCVLLADARAEEAYVIGERIRRTLETTPIFLRQLIVRATVSAGIATTTVPTTLEALLEAADRALYLAKSKGRNRIEKAANVVALARRLEISAG